VGRWFIIHLIVLLVFVEYYDYYPVYIYSVRIKKELPLHERKLKLTISSQMAMEVTTW